MSALRLLAASFVRLHLATVFHLPLHLPLHHHLPLCRPPHLLLPLSLCGFPLPLPSRRLACPTRVSRSRATAPRRRKRARLGHVSSVRRRCRAPRRSARKVEGEWGRTRRSYRRLGVCRRPGRCVVGGVVLL